jgi:hypothetical protein
MRIKAANEAAGTKAASPEAPVEKAQSRTA